MNAEDRNTNIRLIRQLAGNRPEHVQIIRMWCHSSGDVLGMRQRRGQNLGFHIHLKDRKKMRSRRKKETQPFGIDEKPNCVTN